MEITIIHGQSHHGSTYNVTSLVKEQLITDDTIIYEFKLPQDGPLFCIGCFNCIEKSALMCPHVEKTQLIFEAMIKSQIIIIDSPTYCYEMSGQLKTLFDHYGYMWMPHRPQREMFNKIGICISTAAGGGAKRVTKSIAKQLFWWGIPKSYRLNYTVAASSWENVSDKKKHKINKDVKALASRINKKVKKVKVSFKTKFIFSIMRMMQKYNNWNMVDHNHWKDNNWLEKTKPW